MYHIYEEEQVGCVNCGAIWAIYQKIPQTIVYKEQVSYVNCGANTVGRTPNELSTRGQVWEKGMQ